MSTGLHELAKRHFGFATTYPNSLLPKSYLSTLEQHLHQYPFDDNYTLVKQARKGYGILTCREEGCNVEIPLTPISGRRDGGKQAGIGSLAAFHNHIEAHPTHKRSVLRRRVKQAQAEAQSDAKEGLVNARDKRVDALIRVGNPSQTSSRRVSEMHSRAVAMVEPPARPLKRLSDTAFDRGVDKMDIDSDDDALIHVPKKLKKEQSLTTITNSLLAPKTINAVQPKGFDVDQAREEMQDVAKEFMVAEETYYRLSRKKKNLTAADHTRIRKAKEKMEDLRRRKEDLKAQFAKMANSRAIVKENSSLSVAAEHATQHEVKRLPAPPQTSVVPSIPAYMRASQVPAVPQRVKKEEEDVIMKSYEIVHSRRGRQSQPNQVAGPSRLKAEPDAHLPVAHVVPRSSVPKIANPLKSSALQPSNEKKPVIRAKSEEWYSDDEDSMIGVHPFPLQPASHRLPPAPVRAPVKFEDILGRGPSPNPFHVRAPAKFEDHFEHEPVASGSKVRLPGPAAPRPSGPHPLKAEQRSDSEENTGNGGVHYDYSEDDEDDFGPPMDYAQELRAQHKAEELMADIGIRVAPVRDSRDESGDFYGRGRDLYEGPRANHDDIDKFLVLAGNAENFDGNASVDEALKKLGLKNQFDLLPGMAISLMPHQVIGVAWMLEKERSVLKGGCLADDMGLGKTVQMISLMMMNRSTNPDNKTTLILAPLALLDQWKMEIEMKTSDDLKVLIYHGHNRPRRAKDIKHYDVVLTTYSTMAAEWPDYEMLAKKKAKARRQAKKRDDFIVSDSDEDLKDKVKTRKQEAGLLFQVEWFRISLDEGQNIRNRTTRASRACSELRATHRWVMTGTPIINSLTDCYGYIRFLKIRPWYDWQEFNEHIARKEKKNPALAVTRLQAIIKTYQIRRTKESELDGKRLIELPPKEINVTQLEFTDEERSIYSMVEARSQATFNRYLREGTVLKNYHQVLVLLLRLRQICSHPCLIQEKVAAFVPRDEVDNSRPELATELTRARRLVSQEFVDDVKRWLKNRVLQRMAAEKRSADAALDDEDCAICLEMMDETAVLTQCKHVFCKDCIHSVIDNPAVNANGNVDDPTCPNCRGPISKEKLFNRSAFEPTNKELRGEGDVSDEDISSEDGMDVDGDDDDDDDASYGKGRSRPSRTRRKVVYDDDEEDDDMSDFIVESDEDEDEKDARQAMKKRLGKKRAHIILDSDDEMDTPEEQEVLIGKKSREQLAREAMENVSRFLPSTKMKYMMQLVLKSFEKNPDEKILVISQWTSCLSLVSDYLTEKGIVHVKYQGDMDRNKRDQAVRVFMSKDKARIMLMSLKCGGVGLNLTRANNVISLDLAWSRAVESQAWDRVHRLGQTRNVNVQRLVITNTVEDRIIDLQNRKQLLADGSLGEGAGKKMGRLTVGELANLFGLDARGRRLGN